VKWGAVLIVGSFFVVVGVLLYLPARWWAKRRLRSAPADSAARLHVTSAGLAHAVLTVVLLIAVQMQARRAPQTELGHFLATGIGQVVFGVVVTVVAGVFAAILKMLGFALYRGPSGDDK
jgi:hypothetical protein